MVGKHYTAYKFLLRITALTVGPQMKLLPVTGALLGLTSDRSNLTKAGITCGYRDEGQLSDNKFVRVDK